MNTELFEAIRLLEKEKGIPAAYMIENIKNAIATAIKKDVNGGEYSVVEIDPDTGRFYVAVKKVVAEEVENPALEVSVEQARGIDPKAQPGDTVQIPIDTKVLGRIVAGKAKGAIHQAIRDAENGRLLAEYQSKQHDIVTATVLRTDPVKGNVTLEVGSSHAVLPKSEQIPGETYADGSHIKVYVSEVYSGEKGPRIMISRTNVGLVRRLFEMNVPEVYDGTVEIKAISREAGLRSKVAVWSKDANVDAVGACIGPKGSRVNAIVEELGGEKIDVIKYSEDIAEFIGAALAPATVLKVELDATGAHACRVTVPDHQLSLAIGNKGHNARLAARLTGWKIDIRPESGFYGEDEPEEESPASEEPETTEEDA